MGPHEVERQNVVRKTVVKITQRGKITEIVVSFFSFVLAEKSTSDSCYQVQWRSQGGGQGAMAPPKQESQGAKLSFGPPPIRGT